MSKFAIRGIIEGFYGRPWSHSDRLNMINFLGQQEMNTYVYAPKDDPYHRYDWRTLYPADHIKDFSELISAGNKVGVSIVWALSPGLSLVYSSSHELALLKNKFKAMQTIGFKKFGLFFDDISNKLIHKEDMEKFSSLALAQAYIANEILAYLKELDPDAELFFCPTEYMGSGDSSYLNKLGNQLNQDIQIFWTGPQVCSNTLDLNNAKTISQTIKRKVLFWDNYPVNDASMQPELHIGPYINRDKELLKYSSGILLNPMDLVETSKIAIFCAAQFLNDPLDYSPDSAWRSAIEFLVGSEQKEAFIRFAKANSYSCLEPYQPQYLEDAINEFQAKLDLNDWESALSESMQFFTQLKTDLSVLNKLPQTLSQEIKPWLEEYKEWLEIALNALTILIEFRDLSKADAGDRLKKARKELREGLIRSVDFQTYCCGDVIHNFAQKVYRSTSYFLANTPYF